MLPIKAIAVGHRFRRDLGDVDTLAKSIADVGLLNPLTVTPNDRLIAGARRLAAIRKLGWREAPVHVLDLNEIARGEFMENVVRKDFTPSELVAIERALAPRFRKEAKERQRAHRGTAPGKPANTSGNLPGVNGETRQKVAAYVGVSGRTIEKAAAVVAAAEREPDRYGDLVLQMDKTGRIDGAYVELRRLETWRDRTAVPPPKGLYRTIVCDPPWRHEARVGEELRRGRVPYGTLPVGEIIAKTPLPAADDCLLWLWTTNAHFHDAFHILEAWGFTYRGTLTWVKPALGTGDWLRGQTEHALLASRGALRLARHGISTVLTTRERLAHSEKPPEFYELVEKFCPSPRLDLYARRPRPGWAAWGAEVGFIAATGPRRGARARGGRGGHAGDLPAPIERCGAKEPRRQAARRAR
jgi:N6-adenosine-specific RNA methylase IME4